MWAEAMPKITICFLWHMHQPFYKDLVSGEYRLPWARLHALKDYYGMVKVLEEFPEIHATFNLAPSLLAQVEEYAAGTASDPFLTLALKPAEHLDHEEKQFALRYFFQANEHRLIDRYPRYRELFDILKQNQWIPPRTAEAFDAQMLRDLQILSQLAWFDEEYLTGDREIRGLAQKERNYSREDQYLIARKQVEVLKKVIPAYREFAAHGQIELAASPFYHPILPLLCDSNAASVSHPYLPLPTQFAYPQDAEEQLSRTRAFFVSHFGKAPDGLWPSEGSVSDATLRIASQTGFRWAASDEEVLARTIDAPVMPANTYRAYEWQQGSNAIQMIFRDHLLSDLIGFAYQRMDADQAAGHFLAEVRRNCQAVLRQNRDALVPIILDGENAWEYYFENGRPFLRELYARIAADPEIRALTVSEALAGAAPEPLTHIFPGSWIDANFDIWIGAEEDNRAWEQLLQARLTYDQVLRSPRGSAISEEAKRSAWEEILIAEGSDWCWWYGPEHSSANRPEFDQLYRSHLANVYRLLGLEPPPELGEPILGEREPRLHEAPSGLIQPAIDGAVSPGSEWSHAGRYRVTNESGAMHSRRSIIRDLYYGSSGENIYLRLDLTEAPIAGAPSEFHFEVRNPAGERFPIKVTAGESGVSTETKDLPEGAAEAAVGDVFEMRLSMNALRIRAGDPLYVRVSILRGDLTIACLPLFGELELYARPLAANAF
jgi:alpha-amylase/alpha-mannosidase (GH57 family)